MLAELMLPDQAHVRFQDWTIFFLHKDAEQNEEQMDPTGHAPLIYVLNLVNTKHDKEAKRYVSCFFLLYSSVPFGEHCQLTDNTRFTRGAKVKAMAICTRHSFLHIYKVIMIRIRIPWDSHTNTPTSQFFCLRSKSTSNLRLLTPWPSSLLL